MSKPTPALNQQDIDATAQSTLDKFESQVKAKDASLEHTTDGEVSNSLSV
jgi:hypothetical protein